MTHLQSAILALIGLAIMTLGLNAGLGGLRTLGWQVDPGFLQATDPAVFAVQDNHARFLGGIWFGIGLLFLLGAGLRKLTPALVAFCFIIPIAGLFRFSQGLEAAISPEVLPSLGLELLGFPALGYWLLKTRMTG